MSVKGMPQKRFRYFIETETEDIELQTDPKGWDGHEVGFQRSDDFGLNVENVVPLSFSGIGRKKLKQAYNQKSLFAKTKTRIERRKSDWTYEPYYTYKHDYSKFKDNGKFVEISGLEDGLAKKFDTYKDTEYEIDLPTTGKTFIDYTGASYVDKNIIQCLYGEMKEKPNIGTDYYALKGNRSVRSYNDKIAFTDGNGLPYTTMTFRALQTYTGLSLKIALFVTIEADGAFGTSGTSSGTIRLMKHNSSFDGESLVGEWTPSSTSSPGNNRIDTFTKDIKLTLNIEQGYLYTLFYKAENKNYDDVSITDGGKCFMDISNLVSSAYQNLKLECFTYEWLIEQLLLKIDPTATLESTVAYPNVKELISCTPCIQNMGKSNGTGKIKTTLKDVLESFNKLKCIAIDITGNKMTISNRAAMYPKEIGDSYGLITVNNIVIEHSTEHQYNKISVGADTDDRDDDDPLIYPFICKKEFSVEDTIAENELDLVNNFMLDPYAIDKYIRDTLGDSDNKNECEFMIFACLEGGVQQIITRTLNWDNVGIGNIRVEDCISTAKTIDFSISADVEILFKVNAYSEFLNGTSYVENYIYPTFGRLSILNVNTGERAEYVIPLGSVQEIRMKFTYGKYRIEVICKTQEIGGIDDVDIRNNSNIYGYVNNDNIYIDYEDYYIYTNHIKPITNFTGDSNTIYNIPLTPKRILQRWAEYLAISVVGSDTKRLKYGTTTILNSGITSRCDFETAEVVENSDFNLSAVEPMFLPVTINAETTGKELTISDFDSEKYKYFTLINEKTKDECQGWINSITFAVAKKESKQIILQAKSL